MPITYDPTNNIITCVGDAAKGDSEGNPFTFQDLYDADKAGTYELRESEQFTSPQSIYLTSQVRPADSKGLIIYFDVTQLDVGGGPITITVCGRQADDEDTTIINESFQPYPVGVYRTTYNYREITEIILSIPSGSSITFSIYQGRWGVVWKQSESQFTLDAKIVIGDDSTTTWFKDEKKQIVVNDIDTTSYEKIIEVKRYGHFVMGVLVDETEKTTKNGVHFLSLLNHNTPSWHQPAHFIYAYYGELHLYSSSIIAVDTVNLWRPNNVFNCYFENIQIDGGNIFSLTSVGYDAGAGVAFNYARGAYEKIYAYGWYRLIYSHYDYTFELKNVYGRDITYIARPSNWSGEGKAINCDFDNWSFNWTGTCTGKVWRQYEINIKVTDKDNNPISGAAVTLRDKNGNTVFSVTTDVNGKIATQTVSRGWYEQATGDTLNDLSPHTLAIGKAGYQTYQKRFVLDEKTTWEIKLAKAIDVFLDFGKPVVNLKKSDPENRNVLVP